MKRHNALKRTRPGGWHMVRIQWLSQVFIHIQALPLPSGVAWASGSPLPPVQCRARPGLELELEVPSPWDNSEQFFQRAGCDPFKGV